MIDKMLWTHNSFQKYLAQLQYITVLLILKAVNLNFVYTYVNLSALEGILFLSSAKPTLKLM
jgi:hypothetical protein